MSQDTCELSRETRHCGGLYQGADQRKRWSSSRPGPVGLGGEHIPCSDAVCRQSAHSVLAVALTSDIAPPLACLLGPLACTGGVERIPGSMSRPPYPSTLSDPCRVQGVRALPIRRPNNRDSAFLLQLAPPAGAVVGDDVAEHGAEGGRVDRLAPADGHRAGELVLVTAGDDPLRVGRDDAAVIEEDVDVVLGRQQGADV